MISEKDTKIMEIIFKLNEDLTGLDVGIPLETVYREVKRAGLYQNSEPIAKRIKNLNSKGVITVRDWNIVKIDKNKL